MTPDEFLAVGNLAGSKRSLIFLNGFHDSRVVGREGPAVGLSVSLSPAIIGPDHDWLLSSPRSISRARNYIFLTLSSERSRRAATSVKVKPSRWWRMIASR